MASFKNILKKVRACTICAEHLPEGPRPIVRLSPSARILIIGQAPGRRVHASGIPWDDPSGRRLRQWMGVDDATFYDESRIAIMPMGFCYPGTGKSGDLPPRKECAPEWHEKLLEHMPQIEFTLLLSQYAIARYLPEQKGKTVTEIVHAWRDHTPEFLPLPHPSPRNNRWLKKNPWFEKEVLPYLKKRVAKLLE
jgi:uracil-DNA glycosylase